MLLIAVLGPFVEPLNTASISTVELLNAHRTARYDLYAYAFSRLFGAPSFTLGQFLVAHRWLFLILKVHYEGLAVVLTSVYLLYYFWCPEEKRVVALAMVFSLVGALPIYYFFPVSGPYYAFPGFPRIPGPITPHVIFLTAVPNGVPSNHLSLSILSAIFLWRFRYARALGVVFVAMTVVETLGFGEHYLLDLLVAVPYSLLCWRLARVVDRPRFSTLATTLEAKGLEYESDIPNPNDG